ncbi:MAG: alpha/beta fold hydrolase [Haloferacaceae archaeon]
MVDSSLSEPPLPGDAESVFVHANGVRLHTVQAGPDGGPLAVLLHGFPEFWYGWHEAVEPLADAGYRVVVPDQRGYNRSEKPDGVASYRPDELAGDVVALADALGYDDAHVVGHDWGAMVAWWTALHHPGRVRTCTAVNVPHPTAMRRRLRRTWSQKRKSWYVLFFQLPKLPELAASAGDWWLFERTMRRSSRPGTFSETAFDYYRTAWSRPGAIRSMVDWYRAVGRERSRPRTERVDPPTLVVWGENDEFLDRALASESVDFCRDGRLELLADATHWVQHERPDRVVALLRDHFDR